MEEPTIELILITPENYKLAEAMSVRPDHASLIATFHQSLADAYVYKESLFRLARLGTTLVGYILVFPFSSEEKRIVNIVIPISST